MLPRSEMRPIPGKRGWFCPRCHTRLIDQGANRGSGQIGPPSRDHLVRCSEDGCANLIYLDEAVKGPLIAPDLQGRFCPDSARRMGYYSPEDVAKFHRLLETERLVAPPLDLMPKKVVKPRTRKAPNPDQGKFL